MIQDYILFNYIKWLSDYLTCLLFGVNGFIFFSQITEEDYICEACFHLSMKTVNAQLIENNEQDRFAGSSRRGHTQVFLLCGRSVVNLRSHVIMRENASNDEQAVIQIMENRIAPRQVDM